MSFTRDKALFFDRHYFTVGRVDEAELLVRSHSDRLELFFCFDFFEIKKIYIFFFIFLEILNKFSHEIHDCPDMYHQWYVSTELGWIPNKYASVKCTFARLLDAQGKELKTQNMEISKFCEKSAKYFGEKLNFVKNRNFGQ